jgi:tRNA (adenine22-N1)-methyltransferase
MGQWHFYAVSCAGAVFLEVCMKIPLSQRLLTCCNYVHPNDRVADIGCDHGYLGIYLLCSGTAQSVIAADVNEQPLHSAMINATKFGVRQQMSFYLSDGVQNIPQDFDTMVCAGMGGDTMISILSAAPWLRSSKYRLILQCQSKTPVLRRYLSEQGWTISQETLVKDGKFIYSVMEVIYQSGGNLQPWQWYISIPMLASQSPLLPEYYERIRQGIYLNVEGLRRTNDPQLSQQETLLAQIDKLKGDIYGNCS